MAKRRNRRALGDSTRAEQPRLTFHHEEYHAELFRGPLPPPETLARYNDVFPGCPERIVAMAERQAAHRQELEKRVITSDILGERIGQASALLLALVVVVGGVFLLNADKDTAGYITIFVPLGTLLGVFLRQKRQQRRKIQEKNEALERTA